jgi:glutathione S-transferase
MDRLVLYIGEKNSSSWSMRGWVALAHKELDFEERPVELYRGRGDALLEQVSPTGLVPVLHHGSLVIPDSLAIIEYLEEAFPPPAHPRLWPAERAARARARWLAATMHSGFTALRAGMSFNLCFLAERPRPPADAVADAAALVLLLDRALAEPRPPGPFLAGAFGAADILYAPALVRLEAFNVSMREAPRVGAYLRAVFDHPPVRKWLDDARALPPIAED